MSATRIGIVGFGRLGQQIYLLALQDLRYEVVAILDSGSPEILHRLLAGMTGDPCPVTLKGSRLVANRRVGNSQSQMQTRLLPPGLPNQSPWWDVLGADFVIDATGLARSRIQLRSHLDNGARRVILSTLPGDDVDRVVLYGVNHHLIAPTDRIVSAGSASTTATALVLSTVDRATPIKQASLTSVHAYTNDQILQDHAGPDYRRSRSGAENIIPNDTPAPDWVQQVLPQLSGKVSGFALNVPVQVGSLLDMTVALEESGITAPMINDLFLSAAAAEPDLIATTDHPIVSSDVKGCSQSILVDLKGTLKAGTRLIKLLGWHESLGHAHRILDLVAAYNRIDDWSAEEVA